MTRSEKINKNVHIVHKKIGQTPLEAIEELRAKNSELKNVPMTYAGRLDPLAEGLLVILSGDEVHKKDEYCSLDKEYEFQILFGFSTDSYDVLGRIQDTEDGVFNTSLFEKALKELTGKYVQAYPPYSSKTVEGKPLFEWAREGRLLEIAIPTHEVDVKSLEPIRVEKITVDDLKSAVQEKIASVKGDFRQEEILELWNAYIDNSMQDSFDIATCKVKCSSGTYVRALVDDLGFKLKVPTVTFSITRTSVGDYSI